ncbi:MAG: hypothetical protein FJW34_18600, partial [Acidobacteria bacterium]|nr:hypothetical protein [Acidobacteriota bacterium]
MICASGLLAMLTALLLCPPPVLQDPPPPQVKKIAPKTTKKSKAASRGLHVQFKRRPSLRYRDLFRADFRVKLQADSRTVTPQDPDERDSFELRRNRIGVEGEFLRDFEYEVEYDFARAQQCLR